MYMYMYIHNHPLSLSNFILLLLYKHTYIYNSNALESLPLCVYTQVAISYGYGSVKWGVDRYNAVYIPDALFTLREDESQ